MDMKIFSGKCSDRFVNQRIRVADIIFPIFC